MYRKYHNHIQPSLPSSFTLPLQYNEKSLGFKYKDRRKFTHMMPYFPGLENGLVVWSQSAQGLLLGYIHTQEVRPWTYVQQKGGK
jgi:hypothetical protein